MTNWLEPSPGELMEEITNWPVGMPVRAMEQVLAMGDRALRPVAEALAGWRNDKPRDILWLIVLLGELRHPVGVQPLVNQMRRTDLDSPALAAAEGLAKIGSPAVAALSRLVTAPDPILRLYAYGSLGWIQDDRAYAALVEALPRDPTLAEIVALALGDQGRPEAIPPLYQAYRSCEPWQRIEFEDVLRRLYWNHQANPLWTKDWRLRYRRLPAWGSIAPGWVGVSAIIRGNGEWMKERVAIPLRPLEEIVKDPPEPEEPFETCEECGAPIERPTGLPVCPEIALGVALCQRTFLETARQAGLEDLFDLLDELENREWEHYDQGEPKSRAARRRWEDKREEIVMERETCRWLIEQGTEHVGPALSLLENRAASLAVRYGDPEGLLTLTQPFSRGGPKVGRNDPCPCGSGRKYKRCCLKRDSERP